MSDDYSQSEASDDTSDSDFLDKSLSLWKGWTTVGIKEDFAPVSLDLHTACSLGLLDTVRELITRSNADNKNKGGWTPVMYASYIGHYTVVDLLIGIGVDVNAKTPLGQTPLILAASCGNESVGHLLCKNGAQLELQDKNGLNALFHATYSGHQNMVLFLLEHGANINQVEPRFGLTPLMQAAMEGHEIIVQIFLNHGANINAKAYNGDTAGSLSLYYGHTKIVSLIENHVVSCMLNREPRFFTDGNNTEIPAKSSTRVKPTIKGPSIRDGPEAFERYLGNTPPTYNQNTCVPHGYMTFNSSPSDHEPNICSRDIISPIIPEDYTGDSLTDTCMDDENRLAFSETGAITIKSNSSSSGGLAAALGISPDSYPEIPGSDCNPNSKPTSTEISPINPNPKKTATQSSITSEQIANLYSRKLLDNIPSFYTSNPSTFEPGDPRPKDLPTFLEQIGMSRYLQTFTEQDVDFPVFLSLTENHLSEIGVKLFGHRRKMAIAITRWHSHAPKPNNNDLEQVYANKLESEMQETVSMLQKTYEEMEQLRAKVLQEEELRSVTESCLMEEKGLWHRVQRVTMDTRQTCLEMHEHLKHFRSLFSDFKRSPSDINQSSSRHQHQDKDINSLTNAIKTSFSLDKSVSTVSSCDPHDIDYTTLLSHADPILTKLQQCVVRSTMNCDLLLSEGQTTR